jgi:hypothetical protein
MKFIDIKNFKCECGNCEYDCISLDPVIVVCSKCGKQVSDEFKIEIEEVEE